MIKFNKRTVLNNITKRTLQWKRKAEKIFHTKINIRKIEIKPMGWKGLLVQGECKQYAYKNAYKNPIYKITINPNVYALNKRYVREYVIPHEIAHCIYFGPNEGHNREFYKVLSKLVHNKQWEKYKPYGIERIVGTRV